MLKVKRFIYRICSKQNLLFLFTFILVIQLYLWLDNRMRRYYWQDKRSVLITIHKEENKNNFVNLKTTCLVPNLNPFSNEVIHLMKYKDETCNVQKYGKIKDGVFILKEHPSLTNVCVQYIRRAPKVGQISDDFAVAYSDKIYLELKNGVYNKLKLVENHIRVTMTLSLSRDKIHREYHSQVASKPIGLKKLTELKTGIPMNIIIQMMDSQSKANFERQAIKTMNYLRNDEDSHIFQSNTIVGDGTTAQASALLTGVAEEDQFETRRGFPNATTVDDFTWIFKDFDKVGYASMFSEDDVKFGTFNYRLNGFKNNPTTLYTRPFWLAWSQENFLKKELCAVEQSLEFLKIFDQMFDGVGKFVFSVCSTYVHDDWNSLQNIDDHIVDAIKYFKEEKNTMFILFGDHGSRTGKLRETLQGKMEERLPFMSVTMPTSFKTKYPEFHEALKHNINILTSYYDFYKTFQHVLSYPNLPDERYRGESLFRKLPLDRTCEQLGVKEHWCPCLQYENVSISDKNVIFVANGIVKFFNSLIADLNEDQQTCAEMNLLHIHRAGLQTPNEKVQKFKDTKRDSKCDSCAIVLDENIKTEESTIKNYEIVLSVSPSNGKFEVNAKMDINGEITVDPFVSRINLYGNQPKCIADKFPHLRPYCYCVHF